MKTLSAVNRGFACFIGEDEKVHCNGGYSNWDAVNANAPTFAVREVFVDADPDQNGLYHVDIFRMYAVRKSDNKVVWWDATNPVTELASAPTPEGGGGGSVITYPDGTECYNFTVPKLSSVAWMTPEFMFSTGTVTTQVFTG